MQVATKTYHTVGLKSNGTVVAVGSDAGGQLNTTNWKDIIQVAAGCYHTVGLKSDGTVVAVGNNRQGQLNTTSWKDIVQVAAGREFTVGLKSDGTVVAVGANNKGQLNISSWENIKTPNQPSHIISTLPISHQQLSLKSFVPSIIVKDENNDQLTCTYYIDDESNPRDTVTLSDTETEQTVTFQPFDLATLSEGNHTITFKVDDGTKEISEIIPFTVDKSNLTLQYTITTEDTSITIIHTPGDNITNTYRYKVDENDSGWINTLSYTVNDLLPNSSHSIMLQVKDEAGDIAEVTETVYTKAQIPQLSIISKEQSLELILTDNNPVDTQYQILCDNSYINQQGQLSNDSVWMTLSDKKIIVEGLELNKEYTFRVKVINNEGIETGESGSVDGTIGTPPVDPTLFNMVVINSNFSTFTNTTFNIQYDPTKLSLHDLSTATTALETTTGTIEGTGIIVTECQPGQITYTVDKTIPSNQKWSGIINCIQFNELTPEGHSTISYTVQSN